MAKSEIREEWENPDFREALGAFPGHVTGGYTEEYPDTIAWIPSGTSNSHDSIPNPAEILEWEADD